jgi:hypothetical protein
MRHRSDSGICVVQAEDRPLLRDRSGTSECGSVGCTGMARLLADNRALCEADANCSYVRHDSAFKDVEPHWRKVFIGSQVLNTTRCPAIVWLDSDAVLGGPPSDLLSLLRPPRTASLKQAEDRRYVWPDGMRPTQLAKASDVHMVVSGEGDVYNNRLSPFNAGVWVVANTRIGRALMAHWVGVYRERASKHWVRDPRGKHTGQDDLSWKCLQPGDRPGQPRECPFSKVRRTHARARCLARLGTERTRGATGRPRRARPTERRRERHAHNHGARTTMHAATARGKACACATAA